MQSDVYTELQQTKHGRAGKELGRVVRSNVHPISCRDLKQTQAGAAEDRMSLLMPNRACESFG